MFSTDGLLYNLGLKLYYLLVLNALWLLFSIPVVTIGASTTALYYVIGKVNREEEVREFLDFWNRFKSDFRNATITWLILLALYALLFLNIKNLHLAGSLAPYVSIVQFIVLYELTITTMYAFPVLSRYQMGIKELLKSSLLAGNKHLPYTIICGLVLAALTWLSLRIPLLIFVAAGLYASFSQYIIVDKVMKRYEDRLSSEE